MSTSSVNSANNAPVAIVGQLPEDVSTYLLSKLSADSLAVVNLVSKQWNELTKKDALLYQLNMKTLFKRATVINKTDWQAHVDCTKHGLSFIGCFVDQRKIISELQTCLSWPVEKINEIKPGVTAITIPQGLSIKKLKEIAPKLFRYIDDQVLKEYGDVEVDKPYTIIITDNVMEKTRGLDPQAQVKKIEEYGGERPKAIEAITLLVLTYLTSGKMLYGMDPWTLTRCEEQITENQIVKKVVVGFFGYDGFRVRSNYFDSGNYGLAALQKY